MYTNQSTFQYITSSTAKKASIEIELSSDSHHENSNYQSKREDVKKGLVGAKGVKDNDGE